jgi:outer membrane receptor protein involved in Fe transport
MHYNRFVLLGFIILICSVCAQNVRAQTRNQSVSVAWGVSLPAGDAYIEKMSARNLSLEWDYRIMPRLSAGVSLGYGSNSSNKGSGNVFFDGALVSGRREKKLNIVPIMARLDYFPLGDANTLFSPYLGIGAGVQYAKFQIKGDYIVSSTRKNWSENFSVRAGVRIRPLEAGRFFLDARCLWSYGGNSWSPAGVDSIRQFGVMAAAGFLF